MALSDGRNPVLPIMQVFDLDCIDPSAEGVLREAFTFDKINYLLLMMVDKHVHFHIIPRYVDARTACGIEFIDTAWPKPPDVTQAVDLTDKQFAKLLRLLRASWPA